MEVERYEHGVPSWVDLGTPDIPKAIEFYSGLFGCRSNRGRPKPAANRWPCFRAGRVPAPGRRWTRGPRNWRPTVTVTPAAGAVFGWGSETHGEGGPMAYTEWKVGGRSVGGMMMKPPMMPAEVPPHWGVYFTVNGTEAAMDKVKELGGQVLMGPMDVEPGKIA